MRNTRVFAYRRWAAAGVAAACVLALSTSIGTQSRTDENAAPGKDWPLVGGDLGNSRFSTLDKINTQTVKSLGGAWMRRFEEGGASRQTPLVANGKMFIAGGAIVYALNPKTGEPIWRWRSDSELKDIKDNEAVQNMRQSLFQGLVLAAAEGMSAGDGKIFVGLSDGRVAALSQDTGTLLWATQLGGDPLHQRGQSVSAATMYAGGIVFAGLGNGDWGVIGRVVALDAKTGKELWHFTTIPGPGEKGNETWPKGSDIWSQGGAGVWHVGSVDSALGLVYFGTGNAAPVFGGEVRKGDNLYTNSVVALDIKTGKLRWHYQFLHHDLWDTDVATPLLLYDVQANGKPVKGLAVMRPDGYLFLLDRATGAPVLPIEERKVTQNPALHTSATQPFPVGADKLVPECETWRDKVRKPFVLDCPGFAPPTKGKENVVTPSVGVMRVTPLAYSPQTGYFYAQGTGSLIRPRRLSDDPWFWGQPAPLGVPLAPSVNVLAAIDARTNKIAWKQDLPPGTGPLTTAGGLMFRTAPDGNFEAFDAKTGARLWQFQTGRAAGRGPAASYEVDGEQYIAVSLGPTLWAFKLGGTVAPQPAPKVASGELPSTETNMIETGILVAGSENNGRRHAFDEHGFNPARARVKGWVRFLNNGQLVHTLVAEDGSWTAGPLKPSQQRGVAFAKPGTYTYYCKEHPWAIGQIIVEQ